MTRTLVWLALCIPAVATAGEKRDVLMDLLSSIDTPIREADFKAVGEGVDVELMAIADDTGVPLSRRGNALVALQYFPSDGVRTFLEARLAPSHEALLRRKAATSLAVFGPPVVPQLAGLLAEADPQLRIAAAHALGVIGDETAKASLRARVSAETEPAVRDAIGKSLGEAN